MQEPSIDEKRDERAPVAESAPHDPYPKMILICGAIFVVLLIIIFGVLALDFMSRTDQNVRPVQKVETTMPVPSPAEATSP